MDKRAYYLAAINAKAHYNTSWVISVYARTNEKKDAWRLDPYPFRLVKEDGLIYYVDPNDNSLLVKLEGELPENFQDALYNPTDELILEPGEYSNVKVRTETTYGQLLINAIFNYAFKDRIDYVNKVHVSASYFEDLFVSRILPPPQSVEDRDPNAFYWDDIERYFEAAFMFQEFALLFTPGDTEKSIRSIPGMKEKKEELFKKYEGQLHIPAIEAKITDELVKLDTEYRKGDPSEGLLTKSKDKEVVRKKLYMFTGKEGGLVKDAHAVPIKQSLSEGWDLSRFKDYVNSIRSGSYGRAVETAEGGELAKWLLRVFSNTNVVGEDCGTRFGMSWKITESNAKSFLGHYYIDASDNQTKPITEEVLQAHLGKELEVRSPAYCINQHTDYCKTCVGDVLANDPTSIGSSITGIGNVFMYIPMKAMHGKALSTTKYNPFEELS